MQTPYEILGIVNLSQDALDAQIKHAYLREVKNNPPDRNQEKFQVIHNAYLAIKDAKSRLKYDLFTIPVIRFDKLLDQALQVEQSPDMNADSLQKIFSISIDDASLLNALTRPGKL